MNLVFAVYCIQKINISVVRLVRILAVRRRDALDLKVFIFVFKTLEINFIIVILFVYMSLRGALLFFATKQSRLTFKRLQCDGVSVNDIYFAGKTSALDKTSVPNFKGINWFLLFGSMLVGALIAIPIIGSNVLKYLDPGAGSFLIQTIMSVTACSICGIPLAIIGAVVYLLTKRGKKDPQSDSTNESNS